MATITFSIARENGIVVNASANVDDAMVLDMTGMIGAMVFDASLTPLPESTE